MNKQSPEYIRVHEEIRDLHAYAVLSTLAFTTGNITSHELELHKDNFADSILEIKGIGVISDNQKEPEALSDPHPEWNKGLRFMTWNDCWEATQNEHFKRLVE